MQMRRYGVFKSILLLHHRQKWWEHTQVRQRLMSQRRISCRLGSQVDYTHVSNSVK